MTSGLPLPIVTSWASAIGYRRSLRLCVSAITFGKRSKNTIWFPAKTADPGGCGSVLGNSV
jgi:hypothetical protein